MNFIKALKNRVSAGMRRVLLQGGRVEFTPEMVYGKNEGFPRNPRNLRYGNTTVFHNKVNIHLGENVYIGHYSVLDGTDKLVLHDGCSVGSWVGIYTHSAQIAQRIYGYHYGEYTEDEKRGFFKETTEIGKYSGIGHHSVVFPGAKIGKGCLILPHTLVNAGQVIPDFAVFGGNPGKICGDTRDHDRYFLNRDPRLREMYDEWAGGEL